MLFEMLFILFKTSLDKLHKKISHAPMRQFFFVVTDGKKLSKTIDIRRLEVLRCYLERV